MYQIKLSFFGMLGLLSVSCSSQIEITELAEMPMAITNHAIASVKVDGKDFVYTFGGLGPGKTHEDITLSSFKYDVADNVWSEIQALPDTMGKVASAASTVDGKIYIVGGYYVFPDGHEKSSAKVHVYDPKSDQYLDDAADIPIPIDDQVQVVWQDSLIYVISGWSDSLNINKVLVFDPASNLWQIANDLPNTAEFSIFGSTGVCIDNQIYFAGGAGNRQDGNFPLQPFIRIGQIDPSNPNNVSWSSTTSEVARLYRPGVGVIDGLPIWIGGARQSYNYNGIAYVGNPVEPISELRFFDMQNENWKKQEIELSIMDLRGTAQIDDSSLIIAGGIGSGQVVSNKSYLLRF
ncbi:MAG: hypothetical protein AAGC88_08605 [Bacteroidota bacterium]